MLSFQSSISKPDGVVCIGHAPAEYGPFRPRIRSTWHPEPLRRLPADGVAASRDSTCTFGHGHAPEKDSFDTGLLSMSCSSGRRGAAARSPMRWPTSWCGPISVGRPMASMRRLHVLRSCAAACSRSTASPLRARHAVSLKTEAFERPPRRQRPGRARADRRRAEPVEAKLGMWQDAGEALHAPELQRYEIANALARAMVAGQLPAPEAATAWELIASVPIRPHRLEEGPAAIAMVGVTARNGRYQDPGWMPVPRG